MTDCNMDLRQGPARPRVPAADTECYFCNAAGVELRPTVEDPTAPCCGECSARATLSPRDEYLFSYYSTEDLRIMHLFIEAAHPNTRFDHTIIHRILYDRGVL